MAYAYYQQMINIYLTKLRNIGSSSINCNIFIGSISGFFGKNCNINITNSCLNNQDVINSILLSALYDILNIITEEPIKKSLMYSLGVDDINDLPNSQFQKQCNALALVNNDISILQLNFGTCNASELITLDFINTGNAMASCGLSSILNSFLTANTEAPIKYIPPPDNTFFLYIILGLFIVTSLVLIVLHYKNKQRIIYSIDHTLKDNTKLNNLVNEMQTIYSQKLKNKL